ncbi:hypothetical protein SAMN04488074_106188 [Lentzea albidocapillata subsp. violacea]|uniref:Uncharacterized protein n=1 Tax=Lentzea albidocapillata subsp. violacea TaxID=128104 RepID=A0A1G9DAB9_9PSEU|nr:hypothetical protein [Lentzea albidocapillata]SDK60866.1 hypothetical protein SAMN04488074_106188 [Lentzea albidocapillata subsp. violacea]
MDEVDVMTRAGENVGKAVGTGLKAARQGVVRAGHAAEVRLAERGITADQVRGALVERADTLMGKAEDWEKQTRRSRKRLAKKSAKTRADLLGKAEVVRKEVKKAAKSARKDAKVRAKEIRKAAAQLGADAPKRRRWPWVLGLLIAAAAVGYVAMTRRPQEVHLQDEEQVPHAEPVLNGQVPSPKEPVK